MNVEVLPICAYRSQILETVDSSAVTIIKGPTGCGKSTYIPILFSKRYRIAVVEPRRIAVLSLYENIKKHCDAGYKMRFSRRNTGARVCIFTDGMFLKERQSFDMIVMDEIHERTARMDVVLSIVKKRLSSTSNGRDIGGCIKKEATKLLLMSATVDTLALEKYFNASLLEIKCSTFPLRIYHEERPVADYVLASFVKVKEILRESRHKISCCRALGVGSASAKDCAPGEEQEKMPQREPQCDDILVFLPGEEDINDLHALLEGILDINVLRIHSTLSDKDQQAIFSLSTLRKVILSTNICETSLTIPGVRFVIDCGLQKIKVHAALDIGTLSNENKGDAGDANESFCHASLMGIVPISRESAEQRAGRANRSCAGTVYRLYTEESCHKLKKPVPEIKTTDLRTVLLYLIEHGVDVRNLDMIDLPSRKNFKAALTFLLDMDFIEIRCASPDTRDEIDEIFKAVSDTGCGEKKGGNKEECSHIDISTTMLGKRLLLYPLDVHLAYFFHLCCTAGIQDTGAMLVSLISLDNHNFLKKESKNDIQELLQLFKLYLSGELYAKGLDKAFKIYMQLKAENRSHEGAVEAVFSQAFEYNLSARQKNGCYKHEKSGTLFYARSNEKRIVFVDLVCINRTYARVVGKYCCS